jgi:hypothetical protein
MQQHEYSTELSLPIILASSSPDSKPLPKSEKVLFSSRESKKQDRLIQCKHREKMLQSRNERIQKHPAKKHRQMLQKNEKTLKIQKAFLQRQARKKNRSKELSLKNKNDHATRQRRSRYSKRQNFKLGFIQEAKRINKFSEKIVNAIKMLQRRNSRSADNKNRANIAESILSRPFLRKEK